MNKEIKEDVKWQSCSHYDTVYNLLEEFILEILIMEIFIFFLIFVYL